MPDPTLNRRAALALGVAAAALPASVPARETTPPAPWGAVPSPRQLAWHAMEGNAFVHFTTNTFTDREWGYGDEDPVIFDPSDFDADQIVGAARAGGLKGVILTCKHHDGFCLWPSAFTEHSVKNSPFRGGRGDVVREISDACARQGLKFGVYLSPWDRNHAEYGRPAYLTYYRNQLRELLTNYGEVFEVWFDGANGGDGYYGGAREVRRITADYYDWPSMVAYVHALMPMAVTFDPKGADLRWVGTEAGYCLDPCWATMDEGPYTEAKGLSGVRGGPIWWPAEVNVSIRPGWFWHAYEDGEVKSPARLLRFYFESVARGCTLLLNLPPDRRGRIPDRDVAAVTAWGETIQTMLAVDFASGARATASNVRGRAAAYAAERVLDGRSDTFWACDEEAPEPTLTLDLREIRTFDVIRLREHLPLGLRVTTFALDIWSDGRWHEVARHHGIGSQRLVHLSRTFEARRIRLRIIEAPAGPAISEFALFLAPRLIDAPDIVRDRAGKVSLLGDTPGLALRFTTDGTAPVATSPLFDQPFDLPMGGAVQAIAVDPTTGVISEGRRRDFDLAKVDWSVRRASAPGAEALLDEDRNTAWMAPLTVDSPCSVTVDLGRSYRIKGFTLLPAWDRRQGAGAPAAYTVNVGDDPEAVDTVVAAGEFANILASQAPQRVDFAAPFIGRYFTLTITRAAGAESSVAFAELGVLTR